jgi:hypothetical protein
MFLGHSLFDSEEDFAARIPIPVLKNHALSDGTRTLGARMQQIKRLCTAFKKRHQKLPVANTYLKSSRTLGASALFSAFSVEIRFARRCLSR